MFRSYMGVIAVLCLAAAVGCDSTDNPGGSGGSAGTGGSAGSGGSGGGTGGTGAVGGGGGTGGEGVTKAISIGCGNNVTSDVSILDWDLTVGVDGDITADQEFTAALSGLASFSEVFLDAAQSAIPGGVNKAGLVAIQATVQTRGDGATGDNVVLTSGSDIPYECWLSDDGEGAQEACDPANDAASIPGKRANSDCAIQAAINPCVRIIAVPTSDDCAAGGVCDMAGKTGEASQCEVNGFCVTGSLPIPLEPATGTYTAGDGTNDALFGWFDDPADDSTAVANPAIDADGTYNMVKPAYTGIAGPVGLAIYSGLNVQVECVMAVDSGGDDGVSACTAGDDAGNQCDPANDAVDGSNTDCTPVDVANTCEPVTDDASPSPDSAMLALPVN